MEFFAWMNIPQTILQFFTIKVEEDIVSYCSVQMRLQIIILSVAAGIYLVEHLLGGFGLYKIAKRAGDRFAWMAFVPFLNTYLAGRIAGETNILGIKCKRIGLYAAIAEAVFVLVGAFFVAVQLVLLRPDWNTLTIETYNDMRVITGTQYVLDAIPVALRWLPTAELALMIVFDIWNFVVIFLFCVLFFAFFKKYYARGPFVMAFLCALLPFRGFVLFAVRNNAPMDYDAWMQERFREYQRRQQQQYGGAGGYHPPQDGNGQGGEPYGDFDGSAPHDDEPFTDI